MTSIGPYSASGVGRPSLVDALAKARDQVDDMTRQLSSGKVSSTYAGLGDGRATSLAMRSKLAQIASYQSTAATVGVRVEVMATALQRLDAIGAEYSTLDPNDYALTSGSVTGAQSQAAVDLQDAISQLNTDVGGRYMFSGQSTDTKPVLSADAILSDDGGKAGLRTVIEERKLADLGSDGRGRLDVSAVSDAGFTVSEENSGPFGFKLSSVSSTLTNGVASGPSGSPSTVALGLRGQPKAGETVRIGLAMPDGTTTEITLTAKAADGAALQAGEFRIGATAEETAANLQASFDSALRKAADTDLTAASAMAAGDDFFDAEGGAQPARVSGFDGSYASEAERIAALQNAGSLDTTDTSEKTVSWYIGENGSSDPRATSTAKIDDGVSIRYGARANEKGLRDVVKTLAVFSSVTFSSEDGNAQARYSSLAQRTSSTLGSSETSSAIQTVAADLASASAAMTTAGKRHDAAQAVAEDAISKVENVDTDEAAVRLLALQNQLEASYQATATLKDLSLVNFL